MFRLKLKIIIVEIILFAMFEAKMSSSTIEPAKNAGAPKSLVQKLISSPESQQEDQLLLFLSSLITQPEIGASHQEQYERISSTLEFI